MINLLEATRQHTTVLAARSRCWWRRGAAMITRRVRAVAAAVALSLLPTPFALAGTVSYQTTSLGGNSWRYDYSIGSDTAGIEVTEFSIYFEVNLYENLREPLGPPDWDPIVLQPDTALPADGLYDGVALVGSLAAGESIDGFSTVFDYLGTGAPGSQPFEFLDSSTLEVIETGFTQVPEPSSSVMVLVSLMLLGVILSSSRRLPRSAPAAD